MGEYGIIWRFTTVHDLENVVHYNYHSGMSNLCLSEMSPQLWQTPESGLTGCLITKSESSTTYSDHASSLFFMWHYCSFHSIQEPWLVYTRPLLFKQNITKKIWFYSQAWCVSQMHTNLFKVLVKMKYIYF